MQRIKCNSVTEALVDAMEKADEMEHVLILYQTKREYDKNSGSFNDASLTINEANWIIDKFKYWMLAGDKW